MAQEPDASLPTQIAALTGSLQGHALDEKTRCEALTAARGLLAALESPIERALQDVVMVGPPSVDLQLQFGYRDECRLSW